MRRRFAGYQDARRLPLVSALTVGVFVAYLVTLGPHLVHHLSDEDLGHPTCFHLAQGQHAPAALLEPPAPAPPTQTQILPATFSGLSLPPAAVASGPPRAPPHAAQPA